MTVTQKPSKFSVKMVVSLEFHDEQYYISHLQAITLWDSCSLGVLVFMFSVPCRAWVLAALGRMNQAQIWFFVGSGLQKCLLCNFLRPPPVQGTNQGQRDPPGGRPSLYQDLRGPQSPFYPFPVLSYHLPCTWVCPDAPRSSGLVSWGFLRSCADPGSRKASWQVDSSCFPVLYFFHRIVCGWADMMILRDSQTSNTE